MSHVLITRNMAIKRRPRHTRAMQLPPRRLCASIYLDSRNGQLLFPVLVVVEAPIFQFQGLVFELGVKTGSGDESAGDEIVYAVVLSGFCGGAPAMFPSECGRA
ncbi:hypothetical protein IFR05_013453 [Cadophora sp. M221]|nr:hypothetical protein IFR05_013453 [Cadophora sp. M221]